ncbi:hypothetical protein PLICBS_001991 [Purpureocillium lilacinum]|uniref:uncharacterized protein n=1 Tax=Purpureocillium lilacinum TaxID=33203 RepID=UPI0020846807|nr:hypothetical protein PLICBS_001991 [Purpureocillium lilacinum]
MKPQLLLTSALAALALGTTNAAAAAAAAAQHDADAAKRCGRLGVMKIDPADLPAGVDPSEVRMCADHPLSPRNLWGYGDAMPGWFPWGVVDRVLDLYEGVMMTEQGAEAGREGESKMRDGHAFAGSRGRGREL